MQPQLLHWIVNVQVMCSQDFPNSTECVYAAMPFAHKCGASLSINQSTIPQLLRWETCRSWLYAKRCLPKNWCEPLPSVTSTVLCTALFGQSIRSHHDRPFMATYCWNRTKKSFKTTTKAWNHHLYHCLKLSQTMKVILFSNAHAIGSNLSRTLSVPYC